MRLDIDITDFWLGKKKGRLFVAIDRETKVTYAEIFSKKQKIVKSEKVDFVVWFTPSLL